MLGDWDAAQAELDQAADAEGLADIDYVACLRGWVAALRGDTATAETTAGRACRTCALAKIPRTSR